jgi:glutathione S-transferase
LYDYELDENCYKVRLLLAALGVEHTKVAVDMYPGREEKKPALLALSPAGSLPILVDGDLTLHGAEAVLLYLARRYDAAQQWIPADPAGFGEMAMWLQFAAVDFFAAVAARRASLFDAPPAEADPRHCLRIMDDHMTLREYDGLAWFAGDGPTLADIALFPSTALSRDYGVEHEAYPALRRWMRKVRRLPGFHTMPGIPTITDLAEIDSPYDILRHCELQTGCGPTRPE